MKIITRTSAKNSLLTLKQFFNNFNSEGKVLTEGSRNTIKLFKLDDEVIAIKAFKVPNLINRIAYKYFRKSKAQRSFEYANALLDRNILTPQPVAYGIDETGVLFSTSFYACLYVRADLTYRTLVAKPDYPDWESILRQFTAFTFKMHENNIHFLDHSPGNTLIVKNGVAYDFYLVDLNRMEFKTLDFETRMKNFSRLTPKREMISIMAQEYARLGNYDPVTTEELMWKETLAFQERFKKKQDLKKKIKFWKKRD